MTTLDAEILEFFPNAVQISTVPDADALNRALLEPIDEIRRTTPNSKPREWAGNLYTTSENRNDLQEDPAFADLASFITGEANNFANIHKLFLPNETVIINKMWLDIYELNHSMDLHNHPNSIFSGVYFIKIPENSGLFAFDSPSSESMIMPPIKTSNEYNMRQASYEMREGELLIFNSYIKNRVLLHKIEDERISIGFNCII